MQCFSDSLIVLVSQDILKLVQWSASNAIHVILKISQMYVTFMQ